MFKESLNPESSHKNPFHIPSTYLLINYFNIMAKHASLKISDIAKLLSIFKVSHFISFSSRIMPLKIRTYIEKQTYLKRTNLILKNPIPPRRKSTAVWINLDPRSYTWMKEQGTRKQFQFQNESQETRESSSSVKTHVREAVGATCLQRI